MKNIVKIDAKYIDKFPTNSMEISNSGPQLVYLPTGEMETWENFRIIAKNNSKVLSLKGRPVSYPIMNILYSILNKDINLIETKDLYSFIENDLYRPYDFSKKEIQEYLIGTYIHNPELNKKVLILNFYQTKNEVWKAVTTDGEYSAYELLNDRWLLPTEDLCGAIRLIEPGEILPTEKLDDFELKI